MKRFLYLLNFEFRRLAFILAIISACMLIAQIGSFVITISKSEYRYFRYENVLELSAFPSIFFASLAAVLLLIAINFNQNYHGSKSIYSLMALPIKRVYIFNSKFFSGLIAALVIASVQIICVFLTYNVYLHSLSRIPKVNNGLFLAFMRSRFLRMFMPLDIYSFLVSFICIVSLVATSLFIPICINSKKYFRMAVLPIIILWSIQSVFHVEKYQTLNSHNYLIQLILMITCAVFMIRYSIKALNSTEVL